MLEIKKTEIEKQVLVNLKEYEDLFIEPSVIPITIAKINQDSIKKYYSKKSLLQIAGVIMVTKPDDFNFDNNIKTSDLIKKIFEFFKEKKQV